MGEGEFNLRLVSSKAPRSTAQARVDPCGVGTPNLVVKTVLSCTEGTRHLNTVQPSLRYRCPSTPTPYSVQASCINERANSTLSSATSFGRALELECGILDRRTTTLASPSHVWHDYSAALFCLTRPGTVYALPFRSITNRYRWQHAEATIVARGGPIRC